MSIDQAPRGEGASGARGMFDLRDKRVVVIGAAQGIGRECARAFVTAGAEVVACDRDERALTDLSTELGSTIRTVPLDVLDSAAVDRLADRVGRLDGLVFTPAMNIRQPMQAYSDAQVQQVLGLNLGAVFSALRAFAPRMAQHGGGSIVVYSSIRAATVEPGQSVYAASKAGVEALVRATASEYGRDGLRANAIRPGVVETALTSTLRENPEWQRAYAEKSALRRWARPHELSGPALFLVSDASSFVTGSVLTVDGGWTAQDGRYDPPMP